ncbi:MAG: restriction endonuclease subunit S, partial [Nitrospinota bacterium]
EWEAGGKEGKKPGKPKKAKELPPLTERDLIGFPKVPSTWIYEKIGNICSCIVPNRDKPKTFSGKTKWVTTPDLNEKGIKIHYSIIKMGLTEEEIIKYNARVIPLNSIIMTCVGILGVSAIVEQKIVVNQQLHAFLPEKHYSPHLLAYYIRFSKVYFEKASTSTTVQYLNKDKCNSLPFAISNIQEQNQIVQEIESRLSVCDKLEESIKESLEKSEALRQSVLKKAFEGNLLTESELNSCRKEPDWETAEKLLERIKKEKEELNNPQKTKKKKVKA